MELSPPSRGAWIEISARASRPWMMSPSPPSRGTWIEMGMPVVRVSSGRRPPRGGRGLK